MNAEAPQGAPGADDHPDVTTPVVVPLLEPADGVPEVVATPEALAATVAAFAAGTGPVAVDAERASGYRYGQRTYLVQLRREDAGTALIDPIALPDLSSLSDALVGVEWVLHAASQDLPGLAEQHLRPSRLFDTELAARLLGMERVGLAAVVADTLGLGLAKEHSAVDWSTRPLPAEWLRYAALDVEVLVEVRQVLAERLAVAGKAEWARQEFEAVRLAPPPAPRVEPWRRVSGLHNVRDARRLAVVRELYATRDRNARERDISPGRVLPDAAIVAAAQALPRTVGQLVMLPAFAGKGTRRRAALWQSAIDRAMALPEADLPATRGPASDGPPPARVWGDRDPAAARRLTAARGVVTAASLEHTVPVENLLQPDLLRRLCWSPPQPLDESSVAATLQAGGARAWQVELLAGPLATALAAA
ncbi:ribonuclease D [Cellulomonas sp. zg-ZUI222]|uniref:Ribonuclease D n=1 Tax=Cellulomonas wangleii TaxID=2816956 RepID=A0ABX8DBA6_9CELL|nr:MULTISPECIES: HRDC domain-containing protein [Cellulomonas]MBO0900486.1 ribonuclease D [Cellulomonas sp. zg-ZUI22]MBO0922684.1 ribonuclease D [Cellulomonas wangleii]MBO0926451.1 ribonuclease D [Cellulomonas wangleii]QVI63881.1 ribonuclease D [Cellulomonas wangleii]